MHWKKPMDTTETRGQASPCIGIDEEAPEETTCTEMLEDTVTETRGQPSPNEEAPDETTDKSLANDDFEADVVSDAEDAISESYSPCLDAESLGTPEGDTKRKHPPKTKNRNIRKWKQWSPGEKAAVQRHFHRLLLTTTPRKSQIEQCLKEEPILHKRTWRNIKDYIRNSFKQKKGCR